MGGGTEGGVGRGKWVEGRKEGYSGSDKRGKFLKKLWCCVGGRVQQGNLVLSTDLIT